MRVAMSTSTLRKAAMHSSGVASSASITTLAANTCIAICGSLIFSGTIANSMTASARLLLPRRRLEDRIHDLAGQAIDAQDPAELTDIIRQLRAALREHAVRLRKLAAENLISLPKIKGASTSVTGNTGTDDMAAD
jgi:hypothetical protein